MLSRCRNLLLGTLTSSSLTRLLRVVAGVTHTRPCRLLPSVGIDIDVDDCVPS